jgi:glycosyltransferase involved in cell wall biosynthesis
MTDRPLVSVVIPVYNGTNFLAEAVESVFKQTYDPIELIVVDDGSTDGTWDLIQSFGDRVLGIRKDNGGVATALNQGIREASGRFIAWLSHDDLFLPDKLARQVEFLNQTPGAGACYTDYQIIDTGGIPIRNVTTLGLPRRQLLRKLFWHSFIDGSTTLVARAVYDAIGPFDERLLFTQDLDMWMRILTRFDFHRLPAVLGRQRVHPSRGSSNASRHLAEQRDLYEKKFEELGFRGLFPERDLHPSSPQMVAFAHRWFGDAMAYGHHFFDVADRHYREALLSWPSWKNPARLRALLGARVWTWPERSYRVARIRLGMLRRFFLRTDA